MSTQSKIIEVINSPLIRKNKREAIGLILAVAVTIIAFFWAQISSYFNAKALLHLTVDPITQGILVWIGGLAFSAWFTTVFVRDDVAERIDALTKSLRSLVPSDAAVFDRGKIEQVFDDLFFKLSHADSVMNTCLMNLSSQKEFGDYTKKYGAQIIDSVCACIARDGDWEDLLSPTVADERVPQIRHRTANNRKYSPKLLKGDAAFINFVIVKPKEGMSELFFGFGLHDFDPNAHIFSTRNPELVKTFGAFFSLLKTKEFTTPLSSLSHGLESNTE
jgi:hypothetical protein